MFVHWWICRLLVRVSIEGLSHIIEVATACGALGIELLCVMLELVVVLEVFRHTRPLRLSRVFASLVKLVDIDRRPCALIAIKLVSVGVQLFLVSWLDSSELGWLGQVRVLGLATGRFIFCALFLFAESVHRVPHCSSVFNITR